jgi:hypothetical protein
MAVLDELHSKSQVSERFLTHNFIKYLEEARYIGDGTRVEANIFVHNKHVARVGLGGTNVGVWAQQDVLQLRDLLILIRSIFAALLAANPTGVVAFENLRYRPTS